MTLASAILDGARFVFVRTFSDLGHTVGVSPFLLVAAVIVFLSGRFVWRKFRKRRPTRRVAGLTRRRI